MATLPTPMPSPGSMAPGGPPPGPPPMNPAMQNIGAAQGQPGPDGQPGPNTSLQTLASSIEQLATSTQQVARLAAAVHPPLMAYVQKFGEIGQAMQAEVKALLDKMQQGAASPQTSTAAPTPTEGAPA